MLSYKKIIRPDYGVIENLVAPGSRILDLGCGDGTLLETLICDKAAKGIGVDFYADGLNAALKKGLSVIQLDLNKDLKTFDSGSYDYAILNMTLQSVYRPDKLIQEMVRIGKFAIVGFPNFGNWKIRFSFFLGGRMPKSKTLPYEWYNTPNIRLMTVKDFRIFCRENGLKILEEHFLDDDGELIKPWLANLRAAEGVFLLQKG
jgi:methionine biosynthesis protein MetW